MALTLTADERTELQRRTRSRKIRAEDARRAQVILMLADGQSYTTIAAAVGCYPAYITRWRERFETERLPGLRAKYRGQPATVRTPALEARVLAKTRQKPPDGSTHWSTRKLAKVLGISHMLVARVWRRAARPRPHLEVGDRTGGPPAQRFRQGRPLHAGTLGRTDALCHEPRIPLDNNAAERALRGPVVGRKNHYGSRSLRGTQVAALFYTLCENAKLVGIDPHAYLLRALYAAIAKPGVITYPEDLLTPQPE